MKTTKTAKALCPHDPMILSVCVAVLLFGDIAGTCAQYTVTDLGRGVAYDINSSGKVAASINGRPVVTDGANPQPVNWPPGLPVSAIAINDAEDLLVSGGGNSALISGTNFTFVATQGSGLEATAFNNSKSWCGYYAIVQRPNQIYGQGPGGRMDYYSIAQDINGQNVMAGIASTNFFPGQYPSWHPGRACIFTNLAPFFIDSRQPPAEVRAVDGSTDLSFALAINNQAQTVGWYRPNIPGPQKAFRYLGAGLEDLGTLGGANSVANQINEHGVIVGWSETTNAEQHAFVYSNNTLTDLNSLLPSGSGWLLQTANSINDAGQIVGYGIYQGVQHGFLLSPPGLGAAPFIVGDPVGGQAPQGGSYTFSVVVNGTQPFVYQWQKGGTNVSGASSSSLTLTNLTAFDSGSYRVVITNIAGTAISQDAVLTVLDPQLSIRAYAGLTVAGEVGGTYRIDYITNASSTNWTALTSFQLTNQSQLFIDLETPLIPQRTYRAVRVQ